MSKEGKKEKFFCIANCLPMKSKLAKNQKTKNARLPSNDENKDPTECNSFFDGVSSIEARMNHTKQWLQNISNVASFDPDSTLHEHDSQIEHSSPTKKDKKHEPRDNSSDRKRDSLNDSTVKPKLEDMSISSNSTVLAGKADESVSRSNCRRHRRSKRRLVPDPCGKNDAGAMADTLSLASSCVSLATDLVRLDMNSCKNLGITIVGHTNSHQGDCGIFVGCVRKGGAAEATGKVEPGDLILEVNGIDLEDMSNDKALSVLRRELSKGGVVTMLLAKYWDMDDYKGDKNAETKYNDMYEAAGSVYSYAPGSKEGTLARKPALAAPSVEDERAMRRRRCEESHEAHSSCVSRPSSVLMPQNHYYHQHATYAGMPFPVPPTYSDLGYHDARKHGPMMNAFPQFGFPPPNARFPVRRPFLGSELIDWMQVSIVGMSARNEARKYAQTLLDSGYLSGTDKRFHEDGWFAFTTAGPLPLPFH